MNCTNAVQTYVGLCHCGGRSEEAGEALLNQRLKPEWKLRRLSIYPENHGTWEITVSVNRRDRGESWWTWSRNS
jgi:hypothetical protein